MLKVRLAVAFLGLAMFSSTVLQAQPEMAPSAPIPSQILTAKTVFISNGGGDLDSNFWSGGPLRTYNEFYAAIKNWGRYTIVSTPREADLVLEISLADPITSVSGSKESGCDSFNTPQFRLALLDPKTHILLWVIRSKQINMNGLQKTRDKKIEDALDKLVVDLKALTVQPAAAGNPK
jgi:hypothetical protein